MGIYRANLCINNCSTVKGNHLAPCTSIVGPSGFGKSFIIQQIAVKHGIYVAYTSFARKGSGAYPGRSVIADIIFEGLPKKGLAKLWRTLITASLTEIEVCKRAGITPFRAIQPADNGKVRGIPERVFKRVTSLFRQYQNHRGGNHSVELAQEMKDYL